MTGEKVNFEAAATNSNASIDGRRQRSTIGFPYQDLETAISIAGTIHAEAGNQCAVEQLAGYVGKPSSSGTFRLQLSTTRIFGLVLVKSGQVTLTDLGKDIVDPQKATNARVEAFLKVPLYFKLYEEFKGRAIPPTKALENWIINAGVSNKQSDKARQAFERSARQAGFFQYGNDKLVLPTTKAIDADNNEKDKGSGGNGGNGGGGGELPTLIRGLIEQLPEEGANWEVEKRTKWLQLAASAFNFIYEGDGKEIEVTIKGQC